MQVPVYNLEFRPGCFHLEIDGCKFERVSNYGEQHRKLQFLVSCSGPEFSVVAHTGEHVHTANVTGPESGVPSVIPWEHEKATALNDILLLLRLFTGRDVFALDRQDNQANSQFTIVADPRVFRWGGVLVCSIPYESKTGDKPYDMVDTSLQVHLPQIYDRMKAAEWQREYKGGYFLVLLSQAIQQRAIESAFGQCWTICEHIFACLTDSWISQSTIRQISSKEKIAFLLVRFGVRVHLQEQEKSRLDDLVAIRNRLIHFGRFQERDAVHADADMFIRLTEYFAAKALGLYPSNVFNTIERLEQFLANSPR